MNSTRIKSDGFSADVKHHGQVVAATLRGNADMAVHEKLKGFLDDLHRAAAAAHATEVTFEIEELYFVNSSCLSLLLRFINTVTGAPQSDQYRVRFKSNRNLTWQRKSLSALRAYAEELVVID